LPADQNAKRAAQFAAGQPSERRQDADPNSVASVWYLLT